MMIVSNSDARRGEEKEKKESEKEKGEGEGGGEEGVWRNFRGR